MESGSGPQSPSPSDDDEPREGPQSPAPESPQPPAGPPSPGGFTPPPPQWAPPAGSQPPPPPPAGGQAPPPPPPQAPPAWGGTQAPGYGGPVPPGGWQQPVAAARFQPVPGQLAGWWSRVGAALLDGLILVGVIVLLGAVIAGAVAVNNVLGIVVGVILGIAILVVYVAYPAYFMAREGDHNGQTLGKQATGIRVIRDNGQPFDIGNGLLREFVVKLLLFGWVGGFFFSIPTLLNVLWPLWDDQNRALHDMIVSTHVISADSD
jgi:uncharacterized RDD family membrane protein YckC